MMYWGRHFLFFIAILFILAAPLPVSAFEVEGLASPESFIVDESTGLYFISNINGSPGQRNNAGYITRLDKSGKVIEKEFIKGGKGGAVLNAPKGLLISDGILYVSDIDHVRGFDKETGKARVAVDLRKFKARFLNDLAADGGGNIYVTDMTTNRVFKIEPSNGYKVTMLVKDARLGSPNGIRFHAKSGKLAVVSYGTGRIFWMDLSGVFEKYMEISFSSLDGVDFDERGRMYVSSFGGGKIYRIGGQGVRVIKSGLVSPSDISLDTKNRLILVPSLKGNRAFTIKY